MHFKIVKKRGTRVGEAVGFLFAANIVYALLFYGLLRRLFGADMHVYAKTIIVVNLLLVGILILLRGKIVGGETVLAGVKGGMKRVQEAITTTVNVVALSVVYFIGIGFTALVAKMMRKHFLGTKKKVSYSYYHNKETQGDGKERYTRPF